MEISDDRSQSSRVSSTERLQSLCYSFPILESEPPWRQSKSLEVLAICVNQGNLVTILKKQSQGQPRTVGGPAKADGGRVDFKRNSASVIAVRVHKPEGQ